MILSVFLTLSSYSLTVCDAIRSYSRNDDRHRANFITQIPIQFGNIPKTCQLSLSL